MAAEFKALLGDVLVGQSGDVSVESLAENDLIGLYFSAHWCPPCRGFTPELADCYKKVKESGKKLEIVFISSDRDEESFKEYFGSMPWTALGFDKRDVKEQLAAKYEIRGIPTLVLLDNAGNTVTMDGRGAVASDPNGGALPWKN
ncbi:nucleoredoxin-like [Babylonia areolata]|uniref:nucleoredoxin-like n=1 Tax=Babylonia areolata TaxID=304850 RepID=UPI003FCF4264